MSREKQERVQSLSCVGMCCVASYPSTTIFGKLAAVISAKCQTLQLGGTANIERAGLEKAIAKIGK